MPIENKDTLYARWLSEEISEEELAVLKKSGELEQLEKIAGYANDLIMPDFDAELSYEALMQKTNKVHSQPETKVRNLDLRLWLSVAACLLLFFTIYFTIFNNTSTLIVADNKQTKTHLYKDFETILNDGSSIEYHEKNWQKERFVSLNGEAFFKVKKGSPFTIKTSNGIVKVLGTSFNVRSWDKQLHVECYEGKVEVQYENEKQILNAQETVLIEKNKLKKTNFKHERPLWQNGSSRFYNESVVTVFNELERQYNIKVEGTAANKFFSGSFPHNDLTAALNNICKPLALNFNISKDKKTIFVDQ